MRQNVIWIAAALFLLLGCSENGAYSKRNGLQSTDPNPTSDIHSASESLVPIFIIGDSTVHNTKEFNGERVGYGWGDKIGEILKKPEMLKNFARSGASSLSYRIQKITWSTIHHWDNPGAKLEGAKKTIDNTDLSKGGFLLIQFGHNDSADKTTVNAALHTAPALNIRQTDPKPLDPQGNPVLSFEESLSFYVDYALEKGMTPVLITPVSRMNRNNILKCPDTQMLCTQHQYLVNDSYRANPFRGQVLDYPLAVKKLYESYRRKDKKILLLDLTKKSNEVFLGYDSQEEVRSVFGYGEENNPDYTHFGEEGALNVAKMIKELACDQKSGDMHLCFQFR